ncbi:hypothetical protein BGX31_002021, partial [Mortierella sp. GBA43]
DLKNTISLSPENGQQRILQANAAWIRSLAILEHHSSRQLMFGKHCTMLESLTLYCKAEKCIKESYWDNLQSFLDQIMGCLRSLTLRNWGAPHIPIDHPLKTLVRRSNLRSLTLFECRIESQDMCHFWSIFPQLDSLEIASTFLELPVWKRSDTASGDNGVHQRTTTADEALERDVSFPRLRKMVLRDVLGVASLEQLNWLIQPCALLETLDWNVTDFYTPMKEFSSFFTSMTWPNLDSINIRNVFGHPMSNEILAGILSAAKQPFKYLDIDLISHDPTTFDLLRKNHFRTLKTIDLLLAKVSDAPGCSLWVQEILESCPALECLKAKFISSRDIINGKPWVCHRLKVFQVLINMDFEDRPVERGRRRPTFTEDEERMCHKVFGQLSRMRFLETLDMGYYDFQPLESKVFVLPLELRLGLGQLSPLKDIVNIKFHGYQDMRMIDIQWMLDHWPCLRMIIGKLSAKRSKTFGNLLVRDHLLKAALATRLVITPGSLLKFGSLLNVGSNDSVIPDQECLHDSDSDENED